MDLTAEAQELLCRYIKWDLPQFDCERWLSQSPHPVLSAIYGNWINSDQHPEMLRKELISFCPPGKAEHWELKQILHWIADEDPRACRGIWLANNYFQQGYQFLAPLAHSYLEGQTESGYDWNLLRNCVPELKVVAQCLLSALEQETLRLLSATEYELCHELSGVLESDIPWKEAKQKIADWQNQHQHLIPLELNEHD